MPELVLKNVEKIYPDGTKAVSNFNLTVRNGELLVLTGPSGSGKTTLLRMIAGLEEVTNGEILLDGKPLNDVTVKNRDFAMLFQSQTLHSHLSVYDNIAYGLKARKYPKEIIDPKVNAVAEIFGLTELLQRKPKVLTSIQRQRVALCRMIVREPKIILLDEPLSGLDEKLRVQMKSEIVKLHARLNTTVIYVAHDQSEALTMGARVAVLKDGVLHQTDTPRNLYDNSANTFVADFIGSPAINFLCGAHISEEEGRTCVLWNGNKLVLGETLKKRIQNLGEYKNTEKPLTLGVRPEDVRLQTAQSEQSGGWRANVCAVEKCGGAVLVSCDLGGGNSVNAIAKSAPETEEVALSFDTEHLQLFDGETGIALLAHEANK